jgi:hypothetical protein
MATFRGYFFLIALFFGFLVSLFWVFFPFAMMSPPFTGLVPSRLARRLRKERGEHWLDLLRGALRALDPFAASLCNGHR